MLRIKDYDQRAIVRAKTLNFTDLYAERMPLYIAATDIDFDTDQAGMNVEAAVKQLIALVDESLEFSWKANA